MSYLGKRFNESQDTTDEPMSQRMRFNVSNNSLSSRSNRSMVSSAYKRRRYTKSKIPRAIQTRGTPDGYYEIPVKALTRIYVNTSTGGWNTNQTTGASIGLTGYQGIGFYSSLDTMSTVLGNGAISATISQAVPGFTELQAVFDEGKICKVMYDVWVTAQVPAATAVAGNFGAPDLFLAVDPNNADPPGGLEAVLQYSNVKRICFDSNQRTRFSFYPKIRTDGGSAETESGTSTTLSLSQSPSYNQMNKPGVVHFGLRGWFAIPTAANGYVYQVNILRTEIRRYKVNK